MIRSRLGGPLTDSSLPESSERLPAPVHASPKPKVSFLRWEEPVLRLCPRVWRAWGWLSALSLPRVLARSLGLGRILLRPPPRAGRSAWFAHLVPCSERLPNGRWPAAPLFACKVGLGVVTESSGPVAALFWARA